MSGMCPHWSVVVGPITTRPLLTTTQASFAPPSEHKNCWNATFETILHSFSQKVTTTQIILGTSLQCTYFAHIHVHVHVHVLCTRVEQIAVIRHRHASCKIGEKCTLCKALKWSKWLYMYVCSVHIYIPWCLCVYRSNSGCCDVSLVRDPRLKRNLFTLPPIPKVALSTSSKSLSPISTSLSLSTMVLTPPTSRGGIE